jgi:hypothetical protein
VAETNFTVQGYGFLPSTIVEVNGVPQKTVYQSSTYLSATLAGRLDSCQLIWRARCHGCDAGAWRGNECPYTLTEFQLVSVISSFMIYEPVSKQLFVSTPAAATTNPNTALPMNPANATAGAPIPVGNDRVYSRPRLTASICTSP